MNFYQATVLGIVEGLTEFLPVSSTAHLILTTALLRIPQTDFQKFFEVFIQAGAIMAVLVAYFKYVLANKKIIAKIAFSFIPTALVGSLLYHVIKDLFFQSYLLITYMLFLIGVVFLLIESLVKKKRLILSRPIKDLTWGQAFLIGLGQSLAIVPGVSRTGAVIVTMMILGFRRSDSALYSFLLAVPTILAASSFDIIKTDFEVFAYQGNLAILSIGFLTSFLVALVVVRWFIRFLQANSLEVFGWYRILLSLASFVILF